MNRAALVAGFGYAAVLVWVGVGSTLMVMACNKQPSVTTALDVARIACNAVAEAKAAELNIPQDEAFATFCDTREAIAPWLSAAQNAAAAVDAGVVVEVVSAEAGDGG